MGMQPGLHGSTHHPLLLLLLLLRGLLMLLPLLPCPAAATSAAAAWEVSSAQLSDNPLPYYSSGRQLAMACPALAGPTP
jgi:hypothetical protein